MMAFACVVALPAVAAASVMTATAQCAEASEPVFASLPPGDLSSWHHVDKDPAEDHIDVAGAPMSLAEGASAVAPRPIDRPSDARIEAVKRCQDQAENDVAQAPQERAPLPEPSSVMAAALPAPLELPVRAALVHQPLAHLGQAPRSGVRRTVDRPPRH